jgi:hypothetical protein
VPKEEIGRARLSLVPFMIDAPWPDDITEALLPVAALALNNDIDSFDPKQF